MIIDELITLFGFKIDETALQRYKRMMRNAQQSAEKAGKSGQSAFSKIKAAANTASKSVNRFTDRTFNARRAVKSLQRTAIPAFAKMARRINRTASVLIRFRNLIGVSIAGALGVKAAAGVIAVGSDFEKRRMMLRRFAFDPDNDPALRGKTPDQQKQMRTKVAAEDEAFIKKLALDTPLTIAEVTDAFVDMKQRGMDPANGSLKALINTNAAYGGTAEDLKLELLQLGQAWGKNKLQGQDLRILLEKRLPMLKAMEKVLGTNTAGVYEMVEAGKVNRKALLKSIMLMGSWTEGAAKDMQQTTSGLLDKLRDFYEIFQLEIADAGFLSVVKKKLSEVNDKLLAMMKDGRMAKLAKKVSDVLSNLFTKFTDWLEEFVFAVINGETTLQKLAKWFGGFGNLIKTVIGLGLAAWLSPLIPIIGALIGGFVGLVGVVGSLFSAGLLRLVYGVAQGILWWKGGGILRIMATFNGLMAIMATRVSQLTAALSAKLVAGLAAFRAGMIAVATATWGAIKATIAFMMTPLGATLSLMAVAIAGIIYYWDDLKEAVKSVYDWVADKLVGAWEWMEKAASDSLDWISEKVDYLIGKLKELKQWFMDTWVVKAATQVGEGFGMMGENFKSAFPFFFDEENNNRTADGDLIISNGAAVSGDAEMYANMRDALIGTRSPFSPVTSNTRTSNSTTNSSNQTNNITVTGVGQDPYETGRIVKQAIKDSSAKNQRNATTSIKY